MSGLPPEFILCTFHRQSLVTSASQLREVIKALDEVCKTVPVVMPAHPRFRNIIKELNISARFTIIEPVGYLEMISLLKKCQMVITDSGGLQKEAFFSKKMCVTVRNETEWTELVEAEVNFIAGTTYGKILEAIEMAGKGGGDFSAPFYGTGNSAYLITQALLGYREAIDGRATL